MANSVKDEEHGPSQPVSKTLVRGVVQNSQARRGESSLPCSKRIGTLGVGK